MHRHGGRPLDQDGAVAATGKVNDAALTKMLANPFFERAPPKSLDRMDFGMAAVKDFSPADGAATLTAFTAASIARAREHFPEPATTWIVSGGGRHNKTLMAMLKARVNAPVIAAEEAGWNGDAMEAEGFAYLAMRAKKGLPLSLPTTTGIQQPMTGGKFTANLSGLRAGASYQLSWPAGVRATQVILSAAPEEGHGLPLACSSCWKHTLHRLHHIGFALVEEMIGAFDLVIGDLDALLGGQPVHQFLHIGFGHDIVWCHARSGRTRGRAPGRRNHTCWPVARWKQNR